MINYEFLYSFSKTLLNIDPSIRWLAIANDVGVILNIEHRPGLDLLLTEEENEQYAATAISRHKKRTAHQSKLGKLTYALGKYEKILRVTVPINEKYYLLLTIDSNSQNFDHMIVKKIIPEIQKNISQFE